MTDVSLDPAVSLRFKVKLDTQNLGVWTHIDGLGWETVMEPLEEGGNNDFVYQLPGRFKYTNITLKRPVMKQASDDLVKWFTKLLADGVQRTNAHITAIDSTGKEIVHWDLMGVIPVRWKGPSFGVDANSVATESLELAHHGFLNS